MEVVAPALELIGGQIFQLLSISVTQAVERKTVFQTLLIEMKATLISLRSQSDVIRQIQEFNVELRFPYDDIPSLQTEMAEGRVLVERLELMTFHFWNFCCNNVYADQLNHLNSSLKRLLEGLRWQRDRDVMEILRLCRKNHENRDKDRKDLDEIMALLRTTVRQNQILMKQNEILMKHLPEHIAGDNLMETLASETASNTGIEANGDEEVISFEGVKASFQALFSAVMEAQDKTMMYGPLFGYLKSTLDCLRPFLDEMEHNKVLDRPRSELENFKIQMEEGVEIVHKCSRNCLLAKFKRNTYTNKLYGLDQSLNRQFNIMIVQVARDVMETSNSIKHIQEVVWRIKRSGILKNQLETNEGSCQVPEGAVQETMDVEEGLGSNQLSMAYLVAEPALQETTDEINEVSVSTRDEEEGLGGEQSTMADLVAEPAVQETTDEIKEVSVSTRDEEEDLGGKQSTMAYLVAEPPVQETTDEIKEVSFSTRDEEEGLGGKQSTMAYLVVEPPVQETTDEMKEVSVSTRDEEEGLGAKQSTMAYLVTEPAVQGTTDELKEVSVSTRDEEEGLGGEQTLLTGGAVGVPFTILYEVIKEAVAKTSMFKPLLYKLNSKIDALKPLIDEIDKYNKVLDRREKELRDFKLQMEKGPELIRKCSNLSRWKSYKKYKYSNQLLELQNSLQNLLIILSVQQARDVKENLVATKNVENVVQRVDVNVVELKEKGLNLLKETLDEVKNLGTVVQQLDMKGEVQDQIDCEVPEPPLVTVGLNGPVRELKMKLLRDPKVSMLVLTAPGGCGKTTLATKFCQDEEVKEKFKNNIFFVTVSKKSNFNLIVQGIHQRKSANVPTFQDEVTAVKWLHKYLKEEGQNHVLLVLDDVWSESKYLLEKFDEVKMPNFKILVTSRSQFPEYGSIYHLKTLSERDAMTLFRHSASLGDGQWNSLARKIAAPCKGYPLAIKVVGKSLRGKPIEFWHKRALEWSKGDSIIDSETEVLLRLQSSLDALDEKEAIIKECFLDLGSFPQDQRIPAAALIDMWAELYEELDKDFLAIAKLYELTTRSLADLVVTRKETVEDDDYYCEHFVTQHGLLRQLAVYQAKLDPSKKRLIIGNFGDNLPKCLTEQKHQPIKPRLLSISSDGTFSTNLHNIQLADVEVLVLNFNTKNYALPEFVENMYNLKVLIVTNHGFVAAELSNFHLLDSLPNLKRIRLERVSIPSITKHRIQLKSLKKISLFMCSIGQAFSNCSFQISDALPNLEEMNVDYCNDLVELPDDLCSLVRLKKISITNCHKLSALPREIGKLDKLEVLRLRSCTDLAKLPCSVKNLGSLNFLDISDCFSIVELPEDIGELSSLTKINMRQCSRLQELPLSVLDLEQLEEVVCDEETEGLWEPFLPRLCNVVVRAVKEEFSLDWLQKLQS